MQFVRPLLRGSDWPYSIWTVINSCAAQTFEKTEESTIIINGELTGEMWLINLYQFASTAGDGE